MAEPVADDLRRQQHVVDVTGDGQTGFDYAMLGSYDLMLLDVMLPGIDGLTVCRKLRSEGEQAMILMVTARDAVEYMVAALDAGADDYLVKPFDLAELSARVRAIGRRSRDARSNVLKNGELLVEQSSTRVTYGGDAVALTRTEYRILETFMRNPQQIFTRTMLQDRVTTFDSEGAVASIKSHMANLRRKLREAGCPDPIETIYGSGYRLTNLD